jgi:hypothetical protein
MKNVSINEITIFDNINEFYCDYGIITILEFNNCIEICEKIFLYFRREIKREKISIYKSDYLYLIYIYKYLSNINLYKKTKNKNFDNKYMKNILFGIINFISIIESSNENIDMTLIRYLREINNAYYKLHLNYNLYKKYYKDYKNYNELLNLENYLPNTYK